VKRSPDVSVHLNTDVTTQHVGVVKPACHNKIRYVLTEWDISYVDSGCRW